MKSDGSVSSRAKSVVTSNPDDQPGPVAAYLCLLTSAMSSNLAPKKQSAPGIPIAVRRLTVQSNTFLALPARFPPASVHGNACAPRRQTKNALRWQSRISSSYGKSQCVANILSFAIVPTLARLPGRRARLPEQVASGDWKRGAGHRLPALLMRQAAVKERVDRRVHCPRILPGR